MNQQKSGLISPVCCSMPASMTIRSLAETVITSVLMLGCCGIFLSFDAALNASIVQAYTARLDVTLDRLPNETFESLVRRAELVARSAVQRSFDRDILASEVLVIVTGRNREFEAPVLTLNVSRSQWQARPDARQWATRHRNVAGLLGFESSKAGQP
jgi:hypothetical protein